MTTIFMWAALALTAVFSNAQAAEVPQPMLTGVVYKGDAKVGEFNAPLIKDVHFQLKVDQVNGVEVSPKAFTPDADASSLTNNIKAFQVAKTGGEGTQKLRIYYVTWLGGVEGKTVTLSYSINLYEEHDDNLKSAPPEQTQINPLNLSFELSGGLNLEFGKSVDLPTGACNTPQQGPGGCYHVVLSMRDIKAK